MIFFLKTSRSPSEKQAHSAIDVKL